MRPSIEELRISTALIHRALDEAGRAHVAGDPPALCLASALVEACPTLARRIAVAMHERACERGDLPHADLWLEVLREIGQLAGSDPGPIPRSR